VQRGDGVVGEERAVGPGTTEAVTYILRSVLEAGCWDEEAVMDAGEQGAMRTPLQVAFELRQTDQQQ
jgi:hypothetical protein